MKKVIAVLLTIIIFASILIASITHISAINNPTQEQQNPTATPTPSNTNMPAPTQTSTPSPITPAPSPTPIPTTNPTPTPTITPDSAYPEGLREEWLPYASFGIDSPTNQTYNTSTLTLKVGGGLIINATPSLSYSLDGGQRVPLTLEMTTWSILQPSSMTASAPLTNLTNGTHVIVVYGDLGFESRRAKITINFEVQALE